jgi:hypothetical protein
MSRRSLLADSVLCPRMVALMPSSPCYDLRSVAGFAAAVAVTSLFLLSAAVAQPPTSTWVQLTPSKKPSARNACVMVYDPVSQRVVLWGGYDGSHYLNDTWTFDGTKWKKSRP